MRWDKVAEYESSYFRTKNKRLPDGKAASYFLERVKGVEPSYRPWEGRVLPMNYTRIILFHYTIVSRKIQPNFGSHLECIKIDEISEYKLYKL